MSCVERAPKPIATAGGESAHAHEADVSLCGRSSRLTLRVVRDLRVLNALDGIEASQRRCLTKLDVGNRGVDSRIYGESRMSAGEILVTGKRWSQRMFCCRRLFGFAMTVAE